MPRLGIGKTKNANAAMAASTPPAAALKANDGKRMKKSKTIQTAKITNSRIEDQMKLSLPPKEKFQQEQDWDTDREEDKKKTLSIKSTTNPIQKFQEEDWDSDSDNDHPSPKIAPLQELEDDEEEEEKEAWDTDPDDEDSEKEKLTSKSLASKAIGVGASTLLADVANNGDVTVRDSIPHPDGGGEDDNDANESYHSYNTEHDEERDNDGGNQAFMSPTTAQKYAVMSTPFSPMLSHAVSPSGGRHQKQQQQPPLKHHILHTNSMPFCARENKMEVLEQVVMQIVEQTRNNVGTKVLQNEPQVVLVSGSSLGVGTSTFIKEAFYNPSIQTSRSAFSRCITCRGIREANAGLSSPPLQVFSDLLNDLVAKLLLVGRTGGKAIWKDRMHEALGGEGPLLATLVPKIGVLMDLPGFLENNPRPASSGPTTSPQKKSSSSDKRQQKNQPTPNQQPLPPDPRVQHITQWDWNTPQRFQRLCLAVRDLIQAVAEYIPVVMIIDNLQALDEDSWSLLYTILKSQTLKNFLFLGVHDENTQGKEPHKQSPEDPEPPIWQFEQSLLLPVQVRKESLVHKANEMDKKSTSADELEEDLAMSIPKLPCLTKIHLLPFSKVETRKLVETIMESGQSLESNSGYAEKVQNLSRVLYAWTHGNALCMIQTLQLLNDEGILVKRQSSEGWDWDQTSIERRFEEWKKTNATANQDEVHIVVTTRIKRLPKKIKFLVVATAALQQTYFSSKHLYRVLKAAYASADSTKAKQNDGDFPISSAKELEAGLQRICAFGLMKRLSRENHYAYAHDIIRDCAYALLPKRATGFAESSKNPAARRDWQVHCLLGTEFSALAVLQEIPVDERDRFKFLAADQLVISQKIMW
jgi:hypothetical protein